MKRLLVLLFSILISFNSLGETGCSEKDDKEDFINSTTYFQERGGLLYLPNQSEPYSGENLCTHKNSSGQYFLKGKIKNGKRHGKMTFWDENGLIQGELNWKDGVAVGDTIYEYYYSTDQIKSVKNNKLVIKDGIQSYMKDGKWTEWFENGQKVAERTYKDDKEDGKVTMWYENGQKAAEGTYKDGQSFGKQTGWYENGQKQIEVIWKDGQPFGKNTRWHENGQKHAEGNMKDGKLNGKWTSWNEDGQINFVANYEDGECISGDCD